MLNGMVCALWCAFFMSTNINVVSRWFVTLFLPKRHPGFSLNFIFLFGMFSFLFSHVCTLLCHFRGRNVYMQFSSHQELTTDQSSHSRNSDQVYTCLPLTCKICFISFSELSGVVSNLVSLVNYEISILSVFRTSCWAISCMILLTNI